MEGPPYHQLIDDVPGFLVSVLSTSKARLDNQRKRKTYAKTGVLEYEIIDSDANRLELFVLTKDASHSAKIFEPVDTARSLLLLGFSVPGRTWLPDYFSLNRIASGRSK